MECPKCHAPLDGERISFRDECPLCGTDLHACIYCRFYDQGKANRCREPQADYVHERDRANVCEYFNFEYKDASRASGKDAAQKLWDEVFRKG
ncbi:MAG TPA: hypothetical protein VGJ94_07685 [Syntrophorhabdaceae bacterium]